MSKLTRCVRCGGNAVHEYDTYGGYWDCLTCGYHLITTEPRRDGFVLRTEAKPVQAIIPAKTGLSALSGISYGHKRGAE